jgi:hypothetical protein
VANGLTAWPGIAPVFGNGGRNWQSAWHFPLERTMKRLSALLLGLVLLNSYPALAESRLTPSDQVVVGTLSIVLSPALSVAGSAEGNGEFMLAPLVGSGLIIAGVAEGSADTVKVLLASAGKAGKWSLEMSAGAFRASGAAVGQTLQVSAVTGGHLLVLSGKVLAFIPDTVGKALLEHNRVPS